MIKDGQVIICLVDLTHSYKIYARLLLIDLNGRFKIINAPKPNLKLPHVLGAFFLSRQQPPRIITFYIQ